MKFTQMYDLLSQIIFIQLKNTTTEVFIQPCNFSEKKMDKRIFLMKIMKDPRPTANSFSEAFSE